MAKKEKPELPKPQTQDEAISNALKIFDDMDKNYSAFKGKEVELKVVDTGSPNINAAIKIGGYPRGRMTQIYGPYGSGKTFLAMCACANAIKDDPTSFAIWFDAEHSFNIEWATKLGLYNEDPKKNRIKVIKGNRGITIFERLVGKIRKDKFGVKKIEDGIIDYIKKGALNCPIIVIDSLASIISPKEEEAPVGGITVAGLPYFLNNELKRAVSLIEESDVALVCLNQVRQSIGDNYEQYHFPGGETWKHLISLNLYVERSNSKDNLICLEEGNKNTLIGQKVNVLVEKNRFGPVPRRCQTTLLFSEGLNYKQIGIVNIEEEIVEQACEAGLIEKGGAWYKLPSGDSFQGMDKLTEYYKQNTYELNELKAALKNVTVVEPKASEDNAAIEALLSS